MGVKLAEGEADNSLILVKNENNSLLAVASCSPLEAY
jgi:hypothetical protein